MKCSLILLCICSLFLPQSHNMTISGCLVSVSLCRYPLAPSHFDKLGHENKPRWCQENAKYRASFLWLCLFNQLPLISPLHPLFLSFQNVMEKKCVHRQRVQTSTVASPSLHCLSFSLPVAFKSHNVDVAAPQSVPWSAGGQCGAN